MSCGPKRVFEGSFRACILEGTTKAGIKRENHTPQIINPKYQPKFDCKKKRPGKYADGNDCHLYHLCLPSKLYAPFEHLLVECPHSTAFDPKTKKCTKRARKFCKVKFFCEPEVRFKEIRYTDRYFLCHKDQVFEFACPKGFKFDEKLQYCVAEKSVKCN